MTKKSAFLIPILLLSLVRGTSYAGENLILDSKFQRGFIVLDPKPGKRVERGYLRPGFAKGDPIWGLAQWSSRFSIAGTTGKTLDSGSVEYSNVGKRIVVGATDSAESDLILGLNAGVEYGEGIRKKGEHWPHLLVQQKVGSRCPRLVDLSALHFSVDAMLIRNERHEHPDYTPRLHAAQFLIFFTVQNQNKESPGRGDFLWLGVPVFDDRGHKKKSVIEGDVGLGKLIYTEGRSAYTNQPPEIGKWVKLSADLLPMAKDALKEAWKRGFLKGSESMADYGIGGMNMGWELPGKHDIEMRVRNLRLTVD